MYTGTERRKRQVHKSHFSGYDRRVQGHSYSEEHEDTTISDMMASVGISEAVESIMESKDPDPVSTSDTPSSDFGGFGGGDSGGGGVTGDY